MSDYSSDEYHEDSLPDLVLSSTGHKEDAHYGGLFQLHREVNEEDDLSSFILVDSSCPDLVSTSEADLADFESEYVTSGDQVTATCGAEGVRVTYTDHTKAYVPKISSSDSYRSYLNLSALEEDDSVETKSLNEKFKKMDPGAQETEREKWKEELQLTEEQIAHIRLEIHNKSRKALELKAKLGITAWREFSADMKEGWNKLIESPLYNKVEGRFSDIGDSIDEMKALVKKDPRYQKALEDMEKARAKAAEELKTAQRKTSQGLANAQKKATQKLNALRQLESKEYRCEERVDCDS